MITVGLATERFAVVDFKGSHFEREIVLWGVRWYVAYPISYRQLEEMMDERGVEVDHSSLNRWVLKYAPLLDRAFQARKRRAVSRKSNVAPALSTARYRYFHWPLIRT